MIECRFVPTARFNRWDLFFDFVLVFCTSKYMHPVYNSDSSINRRPLTSLLITIPKHVLGSHTPLRRRGRGGEGTSPDTVLEGEVSPGGWCCCCWSAGEGKYSRVGWAAEGYALGMAQFGDENILTCSTVHLCECGPL